jgi:DNA-binding NarL/FixJ family response regulator
MTANAFEEDRRRCFEAGMDGFVVKPISAQSIREEMERVLALQLVTAGKDAGVRRNPEAAPSLVCLEQNGPGDTQGLPPRQPASLENAIESWKVFPPVRLLARRDSRTI